MLMSKMNRPPARRCARVHAKQGLPKLEAWQVVERVEDADHDVEALAKVEVRDVPLQQTRMRDLRARNRQHLRRAVDAGKGLE